MFQTSRPYALVSTAAAQAYWVGCPAAVLLYALDTNEPVLIFVN